jgi:hypothetical protein
VLGKRLGAATGVGRGDRGDPEPIDRRDVRGMEQPAGKPISERDAIERAS